MNLVPLSLHILESPPLKPNWLKNHAWEFGDRDQIFIQVQNLVNNPKYALATQEIKCQNT